MAMLCVLLASTKRWPVYDDVMLEPSFSLIIFVDPLGNASLASPGGRAGLRRRLRRRRRFRRLAVQDEMMRREFVVQLRGAARTQHVRHDVVPAVRALQRHRKRMQPRHAHMIVCT